IFLGVSLKKRKSSSKKYCRVALGLLNTAEETEWSEKIIQGGSWLYTLKFFQQTNLYTKVFEQLDILAVFATDVLLGLHSNAYVIVRINQIDFGSLA
ncbi:MAG: hypothetical protein VKK59_01020, partial [Vampirovibrionales bacterium]|nr:hypothetical protein [Vampirovibrionales bacterium]